ncbi:response regulator transcription factor [Halomonas janggokensis]|jgi:DNA-binding NarL/FixJ family response regulator|uniref:Response regulator transcription factor n=1 Tax=Vreelandella janggokensis TaxID=370767 RepID=A0ABT4IRB8_9GAMM|nr:MULTISPECIES: response regulator transcription factor [Halomonas]MCW4153333.1 response regulator transcription factor [Halomonas sp. 18H]MCZ0925778.1 response regulator transcription factor [Halomonas janggokensis]MCZ0930845.1 response regulator transcription factor [Halomonas janggokensis]QPL47197.1 response regulator transcription factor [Halomonas sp. A40-4]
MNHLFVTQDQALMPRWQAAFAEAECVTVEQAEARADADTLVWLLKEEHGNEESSLVRRLSQRATVVVLSMMPENGAAMEALQQGARGYAHALSPADSLKQIATVVMNQGIWVPAELMAQVMGSTWRLLKGDEQVQSSVLEVLTQREREVALAVAKGASNKVVARELDITERTVKAHLTAIFAKLDIHDRLQLIIKLTGKGASAKANETLSYSTSK